MSTIVRTISGMWGYNDNQGTRVETFPDPESLVAKLARSYAILPEDITVRSDMDEETKRLWIEISGANSWYVPSGEGITRSEVLSFRKQEEAVLNTATLA